MKSQIEREQQAIRRAKRKPDEMFEKMKKVVEEVIEDEAPIIRQAVVMAGARLIIKALTHLLDDHHAVSQILKNQTSKRPRRRAKPKPRQGDV